MAKGSRELRGLGRAYVRERAALLPPAGEPCPFCGLPVLPGQPVDADHVRPRAVGGGGGLRWAHRSCNRRAGAVLGNMIRGALPRPRWVDRWS